MDGFRILHIASSVIPFLHFCCSCKVAAVSKLLIKKILCCSNYDNSNIDWGLRAPNDSIWKCCLKGLKKFIVNSCDLHYSDQEENAKSFLVEKLSFAFLFSLNSLLLSQQLHSYINCKLLRLFIQGFCSGNVNLT